VAALALSAVNAIAAVGSVTVTCTTMVRRSGVDVTWPVPSTVSFGAVGPHEAGGYIAVAPDFPAATPRASPPSPRAATTATTSTANREMRSDPKGGRFASCRPISSSFLRHVHGLPSLDRRPVLRPIDARPGGMVRSALPPPSRGRHRASGPARDEVPVGQSGSGKARFPSLGARRLCPRRNPTEWRSRSCLDAHS
jgi:hypothetical protein